MSNKQLLIRVLKTMELADFNLKVCCCGNSITRSSGCSDHTSVDAGVYAADAVMKDIRAAIEFCDIADSKPVLTDDYIDWQAVGKIIEAHSLIKTLHTPGTSNWAAAIWKVAQPIKEPK